MLFILNSSTDPYFNLATEEYLLKHFQKEITMLWRSEPSVIIGKHQNTLAEINTSFVRKYNIPVIRRLSGGGTVFHDPGNLNFTFIRNVQGEKVVNFRLHTTPVIQYLQTLGIDARFEGKNDLRVNGLKISGNAEHIHKKRLLHHGTLLFNSDLAYLNKSIDAREKNFWSKAVKSVRSKVTNISSLLNHTMSIDDFTMGLFHFLIQYFGQGENYQFSVSDVNQIEKIKTERYLSDAWNFGYSPEYEFNNEENINGHQIEVKLKVSKGKIQETNVFIDQIDQRDHLLVEKLLGAMHHHNAIHELLKEVNFLGYNQSSDRKKILEMFF